MKKFSQSCVMATALMALSPVVAYASSLQPVITNVASVSSFNVPGDGSEQSPWLISSAEDWNDLAQMMIDDTDMLEDCFIKLTADIDFTGKEMKVLGSSAIPFAGTLDGNSKTVKGFAITGTAEYAAPIAQLTAEGTIKNVTFEGTVTSSKSYVGGVVGHLKGTMENVVSNVTISQTVNYTNYVGGIAAQIYTGAKLTNCVFKGSAITKSSYAGGMTGLAEGGVEFYNCGNEGTVGTLQTSSSDVYIGGLCGAAYTGKFINCYNTGNISIASSNSQMVGGLVGQFLGSGDYAGEKYIMTGCYNTANIKGAYNIGGLVGGINIYGMGSYHRMEMTDCYNTGNIEGTSVNKYTAQTGVAGLVSVYTGNASYTNCYNTGNITTNKGRAGGLLGGSLGTITGSNPVSIIGCYNTGTIYSKSTSGVGGIAHDMCNYSTIENCYNTGDVTTMGSKAGGLFATGPNADSVIKNCYNTGTITSVGSVGGLVCTGGSNGGKMMSCYNSGTVVGGTGNSIGGIAGSFSGEMRDCYNTGAVSGASKIGGLIGSPSKAYSASSQSTKVYNCYNMGVVTATSPESAGNVIGINIADANNWTEWNVIENTYYLNNGSQAELNYGVQGLDMAQLCGVKAIETAEAVADADENENYLNLGENWIANKACIPVLTWADDETLLNSINVFSLNEENNEIVLVNDDTTITTESFMIGNPANTTWTATGASVTVDGTDATFTETVNGDFVLTAALGEKSRSFNLNGRYIVTGVEEISTVKDVVNRVWYDLSGVAVAAPAAADGKLYIVVTTFTDGTVSASKIMNK